jgi:hypothetical protein
MKHLARLLSLLILVSAGILFANCDGGGGEGKSEQEKQFDKLKGVWTLQSVTWSEDASDDRFDGAAVELNISGTFSEDGKFNFDLTSDVQIDASPWPPTVKWEFGSSPATQITRLDSEAPVSDDADVPMTYTVNDTQLSIEFDYSGVGFVVGKAKSTEGTWVFTFTK